MLRLCYAGCLLAFALPAAAGNRWMMEQNARELIEMADAVAGQVQGVQPDAQLRFEARVVEREGKRVIHLDKVVVAPATTTPQAAAPVVQPQATQPQSVVAATADYHPAIRYAPLLQGQSTLAQPATGLMGGGANLTEVGDFPALLAQHPEAKAYELQGAGVPPKRSFWVSW